MVTATVEYDYITVDTAEWLDERTAGEIVSLSESFESFREATDLYGHWSHDVEAWLASIGATAQDDYLGGHYLTCNSENAFTDGLAFTLATHPEYGSIIVLSYDNCGHATSAPAVYADGTSDRADWLDWDSFSLACPTDESHSYNHRSGELTTYDGSFVSIKEEFPNGIVTRDDNEDSETYNESVILCPSCNARMSVHGY